MNATRLPGSTRAQLAAFFVAALGLVLLFTTCSGPSTNDQSAGLESGGTPVDGPPATTVPVQLGAVDTTKGAYDTTVLPRTDRPGTESTDTESPGTTGEATTSTEEPTATTAVPVTAEAPTTTAAATTTISTTSAAPTTTPATDTTTAPSAPATSDPAVTSSETSAAPTSDTTTPPTSNTSDTTTSTTEVTEVPGTCTNEDFSALVPTGWTVDDTCTILNLDEGTGATIVVSTHPASVQQVFADLAGRGYDMLSEERIEVDGLDARVVEFASNNTSPAMLEYIYLVPLDDTLAFTLTVDPWPSETNHRPALDAYLSSMRFTQSSGAS